MCVQKVLIKFLQFKEKFPIYTFSPSCRTRFIVFHHKNNNRHLACWETVSQFTRKCRNIFYAENNGGSTHIEKYVYNYYSTTSEKKVKTKN